MTRLAGALLALAVGWCGWCGAAAAEPAPAARLSLASSPPGVVFQRRSVAAETGYGGQVLAYKDLCAAPCEVSVPAGTQQLALREPGGSSVDGGAGRAARGALVARRRVPLAEHAAGRRLERRRRGRGGRPGAGADRPRRRRSGDLRGAWRPRRRVGARRGARVVARLGDDPRRAGGLGRPAARPRGRCPARCVQRSAAGFAPGPDCNWVFLDTSVLNTVFMILCLIYNTVL